METKLLKCQLYCRVAINVNERQPSTKEFYENEIPRKEFIVTPSFIFAKNELLYRFLEVLCSSCRTLILQNISRWLLLKKNRLKLWNLLNPFVTNVLLESTYLLLKTSENERFSDVFWEHKGGTLVENVLIKFFYSYYKKGFVIGLVQPYL